MIKYKNYKIISQKLESLSQEAIFSKKSFFDRKRASYFIPLFMRSFRLFSFL